LKQRLLELGGRCVLTRKEETFVLDLRHIEHTKYKCSSDEGMPTKQKEYAFGEFIVYEGQLYFSECCLENDDIMQASVVSSIYNSLNSQELLLEGDMRGKLVNDDNIDYVIDAILEVCPPVSQSYIDIMSKYGITGDSTPGK
jgi:hypothetical protein